MIELSKLDDPKLIKIIKDEFSRLNIELNETKDVYAQLARGLYGIPYEECLEVKDGKPHQAGKNRRMYIKFAISFLYQG